MDPGKLNTPFVLKKRGGGRSPSGQPLPNDWVVEAPRVWGDVVHQSGTEAIKAGAVTSTVQCSVRIRKRPGVTSGMRLEHGGAIYNILAVLPQKGNPAYLLLPCEVTT